MEGSSSGQTHKAHLLKVWKQTGRKPIELNAVLPRRPQELIYLWDWLMDMAYPLSFSEIESWQRMTGRRLSRNEVRALIELDKVRSYD